MTRADKIRNMTDEQLAELLFPDVFNPDLYCTEIEAAKDGACEKTCSCRECLLEWLKEEE